MRKQTLWKIAAFVTGGLVVAVVVLGLAAKYWVLPAMVADRLRQSLAPQWRGSIEIGSVAVQYSGDAPFDLHDVVLRDQQGRVWLQAHRMQLSVKGWPGLSPEPTGATVTSLDLNLHFADGRVDLAPPQESSGEPSSQLDNLTVDTMRVAIIQREQVVGAMTDLRLDLRRQQGTCQVLLRGQDMPGGAPTVQGLIDAQTLEANLTADGDWSMAQQPVATMLRAAGMPIWVQQEGKLLLQGRAVGTLGRWDSWHGSVQAQLDDASISTQLDIPQPAAAGDMDLGPWPIGTQASGKFSARVTAGRADAAPDWQISGTGKLVDCTAHGHVVTADGRESLAIGGALAADLWLAGSGSHPSQWPVGGKMTLTGWHVVLEPAASPARGLGTLLSSARGDIVANMGFVGQPSDSRSWRVTGSVTLQEAEFFSPHGSVADHAGVTFVLGGREATIVNLAADLLGGRLGGNGRLTLTDDGSLDYDGTLQATGVQVPRLIAMLAPQKKSRQGLANLTLELRGRDKRVHGRGFLQMSKADLYEIDIFSEMFRQLSLGQSDPLRMSDLAAAFLIEQAVLTLQTGRMANALSALDAQEGGKIDMAAQTVDVYVVAVPLKAVQEVLRLPIIQQITSPFVNLAGNLTRFHIVGHWSEPASKLVKKEPVKDVSKGTLEFFQDVAKSGGQLTGGALKAIGDVFRAIGI